MLTPLIIFTGSGIMIIAMLIGTHWRIHRAERSGVVREKRPVVQKVDEAIQRKTDNIHGVLMSFSGETISRWTKRFLHAALVVILHTLHELHDLTELFLNRVRKSNHDNVQEKRGEPSTFLRNVSDPRK